MKNCAVFASGEGSNFEAIIKAVNTGKLSANIVLLVCDNKNANVINKANHYNLPVFSFDPTSYANKEDYEMHILKILSIYNVDWIILAGYMSIIGDTLLNVFKGKAVNIHPSLLPSFPGKNAIQQALDKGVTITGVTIHYVDKGIDTGKIIAQKPVKVLPNETFESLKQKINKVEHSLYIATLKRLLK